MSRKQTQTGFTIIELVVVILLLGILTATALPRFIDVTDEAHSAVVDAVEGGLATGMAMARAQWFAGNRPASILAGDFGPNATPMSGNGYPSGGVGGADVSSVADCGDVFEDVLQGGRPTVNETESVAGAAPVIGDLGNFPYADPFVALHSATSCYYVYVAQGSAFSVPVILYNSDTGEVSRGTTL